MSNVDEILKFKKLMEDKIITKEEFEKKKNELLWDDKKINLQKEKINNIEENEYIENYTEKKSTRIILNILSIFLLLGSFGQLSTNNYIGACILFIIAIIVLPKFSEVLLNKYNIKLSKNFKIIICIILLMCSGIFTAINAVKSGTVNTTNKNKYEETIIFDTMQFYNSEKSDTITAEELIAIKGEPSKIEKWDYEMNESISYPIISYIYLNEDEEYQFYNDRLAVILITKKIQYKSKNSILSMFNLSNKNANKVVDNGTALRYKNCGVSDFWITGFKNKSFDWVKIKFIDLPI